MTDNNKYTFKEVMRKMYRFIKKCKLFIFTYITLSILSIGINLVLANLINKSINSAIDLNHNELYSYLIQMGLIIISGIFITYFSTLVYGIFRAKVMLDIRRTATEHLEKLPLSFIEDNHTGDIISRLTNDLSSVQNFIGDSLFKTLIQFASVIITSIYLIEINWKLYIVTFMVIPPGLFAIDRISKPMKKYFKEASKNLGKANSIAQDSYGGIPIIKAFNLEELFQNKFNENIKNGLKYNIQGVHRLKYIPPFNIILRSTPFSICLIYGAYLSINNEISPGQLLSFTYLMGGIVWTFAFLPGIISNLTNSLGTTERFFEILDTPIEREDGNCFENLDSQKVVSFDKVSFAYNGEKNILKDLSFQVNNGSKIALVGASGCGKSTVLKLISGFYYHQKGNIELFGYNSKDWNINHLRSKLSYVSQDTYLFPGTVMENILLGNIRAKREEVINAAKAADAHEFILELPDGYNTLVGERGIKLSGGQRQRISIARAFLKNAPIILLDEATSALDTLSEAAIQNSLEKIMEGKTAIIVAHRLSTIKNVDEIYVMDNGSIVDRGKHEELIKVDNIYSKLYAKQFNIYDTQETAIGEV